MPPKRSAKNKPSGQSTLAFHGAQARVTKPNIERDAKSRFFETNANLTKPTKRTESPAPAPEDEVEAAANDDVVLPPTTVETAIAEQAEQVTQEVSRSPEEESALKIKDSQIKKYWREKEKERLAPRVHQEELGVNEKILREWDTSAQYGVSRPQFAARYF